MEETIERQQEDAAELDQKQQVLARILSAHEAWFDVQRDYEYAGRLFPGYAELHSSGEQYVLSRKAKLWEVNAHEYLFFHVVDMLGKEEFAELVSFMKEEAIKKVQPDANHMTSNLALVVVCDGAEEGMDRLVRSTRFRKNFAFSFRGWADLRVAVVCMSRGTVVSNAVGKKLVPMLRTNAFGQGKNK